MKAPKHEGVRDKFRDLVEANAAIRHFLVKVSNQNRLRSAIGYKSLAEF
jgi:hypothetical protein